MTVGEVYGRLTVIELLPGSGRYQPGERRPSTARVRCACGNETVVHRRNLVTGGTRSCGCLARELSSMLGRSTRTTGSSHGPSRSEYRSWGAMKQRTTNPNAPKWGNYGGRGIGLCERWRVFGNFLADMGQRPAGTTLDRIDNDGDYEPGNCRWADHLTQARNRRKPQRAGVAMAVG